MLLLSHCYCYCYYFSWLFHIPFLYLFAFCVLSTSLFLSHKIVPLLSFLASSCVWTFSLPLSFDVYFLSGITLYCEQQQQRQRQQQLQTWISAISKVNTSTIYEESAHTHSAWFDINVYIRTYVLYTQTQTHTERETHSYPIWYIVISRISWFDEYHFKLWVKFVHVCLCVCHTK